MTAPLTSNLRDKKAELRLALKAHVNAEHRLRAARENLRLALRRVLLAQAALASPAYKAAQRAYHSDPDGDIEGADYG